MTAFELLIGIGIAANAQTPASAQETPSAEKLTRIEVHKVVREGEVAKEDAERIIANCGPRKFESEAVSDNGGRMRKAKIMLCAKDDETDSDWIATLEKAASQITASAELSNEAKAKIAADLQAEIERIKKAR